MCKANLIKPFFLIFFIPLLFSCQGSASKSQNKGVTGLETIKNIDTIPEPIGCVNDFDAVLSFTEKNSIMN
jgi:hypothetical protein